MNDLEVRIQALGNYKLTNSEIEELIVYNRNHFETLTLGQKQHLPLTDELHVTTWQEYITEAKTIGAFETLKKYLVQLQFPVVPGISELSEYKAATRKGMETSSLTLASGLQLQAPEKIQIRIHQTLAGKIPLIIADKRADFVALVQALTKRNEPQSIPESMGACIVGGYNNWHRLKKYRQQWQDSHPGKNWQAEFKKIIPQKHLYQDRFILLSRGNYSGVSAEELGLEVEQWQDLSLTIRLEHECTHYLTRRLLNSMQNNLLDELIADYQGITAAYGSYRADWWLYFMGLESTAYRQGGRLENYRGEPPLTNNAFKGLQMLVEKAAKNLADFDREYYQNNKRDLHHRFAVLLALTQSDVTELAAVDAVARLLVNTKQEFDLLCGAESPELTVMDN